ncbi:MAG: dolichol kinase [Nitrososphaerota archaeon]|nr:dolichol kinase [Candidatus Bathyarchaeota archaeon]MDW8048599.1 dolichol kinase [Nitrososphaerota archaeon]
MISYYEIVATVLLLMWVIFVATILTQRTYKHMIRRGMEHYVAVYYNRKVIHILAGGFCALIVPFVFSTYMLPLIMACMLALFLYLPHRTGKIFTWFQTEDNMYEVSFCIMWGAIISLGWLLSGGNFWIGILPVLFMSIGDAVTGIVRNLLYGKRTKSWWGNLAMAFFSVTVGAVLGYAGILAGAAASFIEHFEFNPIDDNVTVPIISFIILMLAKTYAPWLLTI